MRFPFLFIGLALSVVHSPGLRADISLPQYFTDNMVLQRETQTPIFGTAKPGQKLQIEFGSTTMKATANENGAWKVLLPTGPAGGPFELKVTAENAQPQIKLANVMVGEVWLCSGQSNMSWPVAKALNATTEIEQSINFPNIRLFRIEETASPQPLEEFEKVAGWRTCSPDSVGEFSASAYFFGREMSKKFPDVPIGLIQAAWGGTACEAWVSRPSLESVPRFVPMLEHWTTIEGPKNRNRPAVLFNGMISPLKSIPFRGVIWYQGEANNGRGEQYSELFPTLIRDWRTYFQNEQLPFYFVQLAPFRYSQKPPEGLAEIWDAQLKTFKTVPATGMVVTTDIGDVDDVHPPNKQEVGRRLSLVALGNVYRDQLPVTEQALVWSGPIYQAMSTNGPRVRLTFQHADGLQIRGGEDSLSCFTICGADQNWVPADAKIVNGAVEVTSPKVETPVAVRFGWTDTAVPNLINAAGLPASPFRTDEFPLQSKGRDF